MRTDAAARHRANRHRRIGRAIARGAHIADGLVQRMGHHRKADDIGRLALIGGHAKRGVALEMLDRLEALTMGQLNIGHRHIMLQVDERLAGPRLGHGIKRLDGVKRCISFSHLGHCSRPCRKTGGAGRSRADTCAIGQPCREIEHTVHATRTSAFSPAPHPRELAPAGTWRGQDHTRASTHSGWQDAPWVANHPTRTAHRLRWYGLRQ
jgi:hypothetical protein